MFTRLDSKRVGTYTAAFVGAVSAAAGLYSWLEFSFLEQLEWNVWAVLLTISWYILGLYLLQVDHPADVEDKTGEFGDGADLYASILQLLRQALGRAEYHEVIRFGDALSRPLFESGEFGVRLDIGRITEEAAAHVTATDVQYRTLIDAIGWSLIELGEFAEARASIAHGMELAQSVGDAFYVAKANRHLGAIERRMGKNDTAVEFYEKASSAAEGIADDHLALAMRAGITYAIAHLRFSEQQFEAALQLVNSAIAEFGELDDIYRVDMARVLRADIQVAMRQFQHAKDSYREVIHSSKTNRESVHYHRAVIGLAELYLEEQNRQKARELLDRLDAEHVAQLPAFSARFTAADRLAGKNP